jgi:hypothetical protein
VRGRGTFMDFEDRAGELVTSGDFHTNILSRFVT